MWVDALRSGEYTQVTGALVNSIGYCCLGVACELFIAAHPRSLKKNDKGDQYCWRSEDIDYSEGGELPDPVAEWLGFEEITDPYLDDEGHTAVHFNDAYHSSFTEIADAIEQHYLGD